MDPSIAFPTDLRARLHEAIHGWWRLALVAGVLLVFAVGATAFSRSGFFHVRTIRVEGADHLSRAEVVRLAGVSRQDNTVWLDEGSAVERLMGESWVATAHVEVDLPSTVTITVTERSPIAIVERGGVASLVAGDGTVLGMAPRGIDLPTISLPPSWLRSGIETDLGAVARALACLNQDVRDRVERVAAGGTEGIELYLRDGIRIALGGDDSPVRKAHAIADVLAWVDATGAEIRSIDVSAPSAPVVVPAP